MIWKHKLAVLMIAVFLSGGACTVIYSLPAIYKAEATILVDSQKIPERYVSSTVNADLTDRVATISQQILSTTALKKVIDDFDLYRTERQRLSFEEIIERMRKDTTISSEKGWTGNRPGAFHVGFSGSDPNTVAGVANRLANLFVEENLKTREVQAEGTSEFIVTQLAEAKKKLDDLESQISRYKLQHNGELPEQETELMAAVTRLQMVLQGDQDAVTRAHENKMLLDNSLNVTQAMGEAMQARAADTSVQNPVSEQAREQDDIAKQIARKEAQLESMRTQFTDNYPDVRLLRTEIAQLRARKPKPSVPGAVAAARPASPEAAARTRMAPQDNLRISQIKAQLKMVDDEIDHRTAEEDTVKKQISDIQSRIDQLPVREQEMASLTRDYQMSKQNYQSLLDKKLSADMASEMERRQKAERFTILDPARVPVKPFKPNRPLLYSVSGVVALALGLVFAVGSELKSDVLLGEWELPADLKVLGYIPVINAAKAAKKARPPQKTRRWRLRRGLEVMALQTETAIPVAHREIGFESRGETQ
jgi:polysaccharide chain length determinant protein (PEP-CTERM system associated)